jgi:hypothetical protein
VQIYDLNENEELDAVGSPVLAGSRDSVANFLGGYVAHGYDGLYPANE